LGSQDVSQTNHLIRRSGVWYYRRRVPKALHAKLGKKEIQLSLGTSKLADAKKLRAVEDLKWAARFESAIDCTSSADAPGVGQTASGQILSESEVLQRVREFVTAEGARSSRTLTQETFTHEERQETATDIEYGMAILKDPEDPRLHELIDGGIKSLGSPRTASAGTSDALLAEVVRRGLVELQQRKLSVLNDDHSRSFFDHLFAPHHKPDVTFRQLTDQVFENLREDAAINGTSLKWVDKQRAFLSLLVEIVGDQTPVRSIDYDVCLKVRGTLARLPAGRTKAYSGMTLDQAIAKGEAQNAHRLSPVTQEQYLATFRNTLSLAAKKQLIGMNPAEDLKPLKRDAVSNSQKRLPFTHEQLKRIFEGGFYRSAAQHSPAYSIDKNGWRFWLPILCLFMGLRPNEACQMRPSDVKCSPAGTWYVDIIASEDDEDGSDNEKTLKTLTSRRRVPVHPELLAIGFVEYAQSRLECRATLLFDGIRADQYGNHAKYALKRFREQYLPNEIELEPRQSFYSFRHNFRDALRRADAPPDALQALGGWSQGKLVSDSYGERDNPDYQLQFMRRVSFPSLKLDHLHAEKNRKQRVLEVFEDQICDPLISGIRP
jgi:integrase